MVGLMGATCEGGFRQSMGSGNDNGLLRVSGRHGRATPVRSCPAISSPPPLLVGVHIGIVERNITSRIMIVEEGEVRRGGSIFVKQSMQNIVESGCSVCRKSTPNDCRS